MPRVSDLEALAASTSGKVEIESIEEGRDGSIIEGLVKASILTVFKGRFTPDKLREVITAFDEGLIAHVGEDVSSADEADMLARVPSLREPVSSLTDDESPAAVASAVEFLLEGLHLSKRLNKDSAGARADLPQQGLISRRSRVLPLSSRPRPERPGCPCRAGW